MSKADLFKSRDAMPAEAEGVAVTMMTSATSPYAKLPGERKFSNDVRSVRERPQATGRRP